MIYAMQQFSVFITGSQSNILSVESTNKLGFGERFKFQTGIKTEKEQFEFNYMLTFADSSNSWEFPEDLEKVV